MTDIAIVDYGMGNLRSVKQALLHVAPANTHISVSENPTQIANADAIVFPGQGAAKACMNALNNIEGLRESVLTAAQQKPFLGICMGMQVLMSHSAENGGVPCLDLFKGDVLAFAGQSTGRGEVPAALRPSFEGEALLDLVMGAQLGEFAGQSLFDAFNSAWELDSRADRMGIRLLGPALQYQGRPMISEGIPLGAVQVPPDGQPIVLLNDRQTIGGYPRLGALTPLALAQLAQCLPGAKVRLRPVVQDVAHREHVEYLKRF